MKKIKLTQGKYALVDDEDYEYLNQWKWYFHSTGYAVRNCYKNGHRHIKLHRFLLSAGKKEIDHINGNRLDNRKKNLRRVFRKQNVWNSKKWKNKTSSKGVDFTRNKWRARIGKNWKSIHLGYFKTEKEARKAYIKAAKEFHGEYASWKR